MSTTNGNGKKHAARLARPADVRPYFFFDVQWWLVSTATMNAYQKSAFIDMCGIAWQSDPPATLPADDAELAAIARVSVDEWHAMSRPLLAHMRKDGRRLIITKLYEQYKVMCDEHTFNVERGRTGARKRWQR